MHVTLEQLVPFPLAVFLLTVVCLVSDASAQTVESERITLQPGNTLDREINGNQSTKFRIELGAGQAATVTAKETGVDIALRLVDSDGKLIVEVDNQNSTNGGEMMSLVAEAATVFNINVSTDLPKVGPRGYSITLSEPRAATANDKALYKAFLDHGEAARAIGTGNQGDKALELSKSILATRESVLGAEDPLVGDTLILVGQSYAMKGDLAQALANISRAVAILEKAPGKNSLLYTRALFALGRMHFGRGDLKTAEDLMLQTLAIVEKMRDGGGLQAAIALSRLGLVYRGMTDFRRSEEALRKSLDVLGHTVGEDHIRVAEVRNVLGLMYNSAGDYVNAEKEFERSLAISERLNGSDNRSFAMALNNLGLVQWQKGSGDYPKAEATWNRALKIFEKVNGPESDGVANVLGNLGMVYEEYYRDFQKAESAQKRALSILEKLSGETDHSLGPTVYSLASIYRSLGDYARSETFALRSYDILTKTVGPMHENVALNLSFLAEIRAIRGDIPGSLGYQHQVDKIESAAIQNNIIAGSERQKIGFFTRLRSLDRSVSFLTGIAPDSADARDLVLSQILQRKGRVLDALSQNLTEFKKRGGEQDTALLAKLNDLTAEISKVSSQGRQDKTQADFDANLKSLLAEREKIEIEISRRTAGAYVPTTPIALSAVKGAVPDGSALIEFAVYRPLDWKSYNAGKDDLGPARYIAFVVRNQGEIGWLDLGDAKAIDDAIGKLRSALRDPARDDVTELSRVVDQKVTEPLRKLTGTASHLIVSPDGELNLLPFEALVDENRRYLAQRFSFTYVSSGRDILKTSSTTSAKNDLVIVANPTFGLPADTPPSSGRRARPIVQTNRLLTRSLSDTFFAPLVGTARESAAIRTLFPEAKLFTGEEATETSLKQVRSPGILHIATHGFFLNNDAPTPNAEAKPSEPLSDNPLLRSGLAFAGANIRKGEKDDGILTGLEASGLDLSGTKLVVLSACDTGIGEIKNGEGVYGLRRSFALAGAESLVMSLWPVSDNVTRELMTGFYGNLKKGMGRGKALRQVRLEMIKQPNRKHPFYWASFIQSGEWANLDGKR